MSRLTTRRRRHRTMINDIPLTPLIDTALTLLVIFMVTTPMIHNAIKVELPKGNMREEKGSKQELVVYVDRYGKMFFNDSSMRSEKELVTAIKQATGTDTDRMVFVKGDQAANYGRIIELVDHLKDVGGIKYVVLATKRA